MQDRATPEQRAARLARLRLAAERIVERRRAQAAEALDYDLDEITVEAIADLMMLDIVDVALGTVLPRVREEALSTARSALDVWRTDLAKLVPGTR